MTTEGRNITRAAIRQCLPSGVEQSELAASADIDGLTALFDARLLGFSIQARDGFSVWSMESVY